MVEVGVGPGAEIQGDVGTLSNTGTPRSLDRAQLPLWVQNPERHLSRPRADPPTRRPGWAAGRCRDRLLPLPGGKAGQGI